MWQKASTLSGDSSTSLGAFVGAPEFLSKNLGQNEVALVPMIDVFYALNPGLHDKLIDYKALWDSAGVVLMADTTTSEVLRVRNYFIDFLKKNSQVKYIVRDWVDPYDIRIYELNVKDELMLLLHEMKMLPFMLSTGWSNQVTIYNRVQYTPLFAMKFSSSPKQYFTIPSNAYVKFDSNGVTIQKSGQWVGFYLPLDVGINASRQNYLTLQFRPDIENLSLSLVFYYDKNGDGVFSGYDVDYTKGTNFNQTQKGWAKDEWHQIALGIPQEENPLVQISIITQGGTYGTLTLANLEVYTE
jgi:hypothetical protein